MFEYGLGYMGVAVHSKVLYEPVIWKQLGTIKTFLHYIVVFIHLSHCSLFSLILEKSDYTTNIYIYLFK